MCKDESIDVSQAHSHNIFISVFNAITCPLKNLIWGTVYQIDNETPCFESHEVT